MVKKTESKSTVLFAHVNVSVENATSRERKFHSQGNSAEGAAQAREGTHGRAGRAPTASTMQAQQHWVSIWW